MFQRVLKICYALQFVVFMHNSFDFGNLGLWFGVLESLLDRLTVSCFEFLHLKCRDFCKSGLKTSSFLDSGFLEFVILCNDLGGFKKGFWK